MNALPANKVAWLKEIAAAYLDALESIPFAEVLGKKLEPKDVFHFAPAFALKKRGIKISRKNLEMAAEPALVSYVANLEDKTMVLSDPIMGFSFTYLVSHLGLGLLSEDDVDEIMCYVEQRHERLMNYIKKGENA